MLERSFGWQVKRGCAIVRPFWLVFGSCRRDAARDPGPRFRSRV